MKRLLLTAYSLLFALATAAQTLPSAVVPQWIRTGQMPARDVAQVQTTTNYFVLSFIMPAPEMVKERRENITANFAFEGSGTHLDVSYADNATKLIAIERTINSLKENRNITITGVKIVGYTSIDGYVEENAELSQTRARALGEYFQRYYGYPVSYHWRGEDWTGLATLVQNSTLPDRAQVINIINTTEDINYRKVLLRRLSGGATYRTMQRTLFPQLRRTDYTITYEIKNFDLAESQLALTSQPQLLSLNELYALAASYPVGSREFLEVFDVASRLYPTDIAAKINNAVLDILDGANDRAIAVLQHITDAAAVNNMGVAYARKGDMPRAVRYFEQASQRGNRDADNNLRLAHYWGF